MSSWGSSGFALGTSQMNHFVHAQSWTKPQFQTEEAAQCRSQGHSDQAEADVLRGWWPDAQFVQGDWVHWVHCGLGRPSVFLSPWGWLVTNSCDLGPRSPTELCSIHKHSTCRTRKWMGGEGTRWFYEGLNEPSLWEYRREPALELRLVRGNNPSH